MTTNSCPCGSGKVYAECCGPLHSGEARASTAEQLMRSRFSAYALSNAAYLLWTRLEILGATDGGPFHTAGTVEFRAYYRERGGAEQFMQENSTFAREDGAWAYVSAL